MQDKIVPVGKWSFDESVTAVFNDMLSRSIPQYIQMREISTRIGLKHVVPGTAIVDIGCSNGNAIAPFYKRFSQDCEIVMLDVSAPMLDKCRGRFQSADVREWDLRNGLPKTGAASLILSVLTLQFTPLEYRHKIVKSVFDSLIDGGAFILVEKVLGSSAETDGLLTSEYYRIKKENNYTPEQIESKRRSLEGVLVPLTARWNEDLLLSAGFTRIECFWRVLNFAGWIAIK